MKIVLIIILSFILISRGWSQISKYLPREMEKAMKEGTRSYDGRPGPNYWQNRADYTMSISFDPKTLLLNGSESIAYFNNSSDTLHEIIIHLYPDFYKKGLMRNYGIDEKDENEGVTVEILNVAGERINVNDSAGHTKVSGTNLKVVPKHPLLPKSKVTLEITWHYILNKGSHVRTGMVDSTSFFLAYTFPRIAVYDDIDGWDESSYTGLQEFYNDFGNFDASIMVPRGFLVWATGELQNDDAVYDKKILNKYHDAIASDDIMHIIEESDYKKGWLTSKQQLVTWKFSAKNVTDFAFCLSDHFLWDGSSVVVDKSNGRRVFVDAVYDRYSKDFPEVAAIARKSVEVMSYQYPGVPFPFPHETVFNGLDQMEYPMMVNDNSSDSRKDMVQLTTHEIMHAYFPFYMGINESKYAWMDEGWATIGESVLSPMMGEPEDEGIYMRTGYEYIAGTEYEAPMITNSQIITSATYFTNSYGKPGLFYWTLQKLLGDELFFKALHEYMNRWNGKHPTPYDFFFTFSDVAGEDLSWFYKPWFFDTGYPDLGIKEVKMPDVASGSSNGGSSTNQSMEKYQVVVERKGNIPVPVHLEFILQKDSIIKVDYSPAVWKDGKAELQIGEFLPGKLKEVRLGNEFIPDVDRKDNVWKMK